MAVLAIAFVSHGFIQSAVREAAVAYQNVLLRHQLVHSRQAFDKTQAVNDSC